MSELQVVQPSLGTVATSLLLVKLAHSQDKQRTRYHLQQDTVDKRPSVNH